MKPSQLNDRQKRMILQYELPDSVLGERFGISAVYIAQVRKRLKDTCNHLWVGWTDIEACEICQTTRPIVEQVGYIETATGEELDAVAHNVKRAWGESDQAFRQRILDLEIAQDERT